MAIEDINNEEEENDFFDYAGDIIAAPFRGIEGALQGAYNLADYLAFDILPDYDTRFLGTSKTMAGGAVEGIAQFATGFVPLFGLAGRAGMLAKAPITRGIVAGAATDFTFFNGQEARLSNLIQQVPELQNPVTEFLAYDGDEGELEGRMKNVLEGLGLEAVAGVFIKSLKAMKKARKVKEETGDAQKVADSITEDLAGEIAVPTRELVEEPEVKVDVEVDEDIPLGTKRSPFVDPNLTTLDDDAFDAVEIKARKDLEKLEEQFDAFPMKRTDAGFEVDAPIDFKKQMAAAQDAFSAVELEKFRRQIEGEEPWFIASEFRTLADATQDSENMFKLALLGETVKKRGIQKEVLAELEAKIGKDENAKEVFEGQLKKAQEAMESFKKPKPTKEVKQIEAFAPKPTEPRKSPFTDIRTKLIIDDKVSAIKSLDEDLGQINPALKEDFYDKTIVEKVASRMQTDNPMTVREALEDLNGRTNGNLGQYTPIVKKLLALGKDTGIDAKLEDRAFASNVPSELPEGSFYESGKRRVVFDGRSAVLRKNPVYVLLHEGTHAVTVDNVNKFFDANSFNKITSTDIAARAKAIDAVLKKDLPKPIAEMFRMFKKADSMRDDIVASGADESLYWIKNPAEFMSMAFSDPRLQEALKGIQYTPKMTMWEKIVNTVKSFFGRGVSTDLADNIVSRVGEIAEMKLPDTKRIGVDMLPEEEISDLDKWYYSDLGKQSDKLLIDQERRIFTMDFTPVVRGEPMLYSELRKRIENAIKEEAYEEAGELQFYLNKANKKIDKHLQKVAKDEGIDLSTIDFAPELPKLDPKKPNEFLEAVPEKFRGYADELLKGGTPRLPQFALETDGDVVVLKDILEQYYKENPDKVTVEDAITEVDTEIEQMLMLQEGKDAATKIAEARVVQQSLRDQAKAVVDNLTEAVEEYRVAGGGSAAIAKLKNNFQQLLSVADVYRRLGREGSLLLGSRRENYGQRKIGLSQSDAEIEGLRNAFINESGGMHPDKLVTLIRESIDKENPDSMINSMFKLAKQAQGKHFLDMPTEYWMNAILSGPKTQMVNIMGNSLTQVMATIEAVAGSLITGNTSVVKAVLASWADGKMISEAARFAKKAFKQNDNLLDPQARAFSDRPQGAITGDRIAGGRLSGMVTERGLTSRKSLDAMGNFIRIPSRLLLTTDEFFKQLAYRRAARLKAAMSGLQQGIKDPKKLAEHIHNTLEGIITEGGRMASEVGLAREANEIAAKKNLTGVEKDKFILKYSKENFDKNKSALIQYAQDEAQYLTFTRDLQDRTLGKVLQEATNKLPMLRLVLPFVRTPTNLLKYAFERTPGVFVLKEERQRLFEDLKSGDPIRQSQAAGKMMTAVAVAGVFVDTIYNNREFITGGGPIDPKKKEALMATGWRPYSIKVFDTYYSYQRLDPIATLLGVGADLVEVGLREPRGFDESGVERTFLALTLSITRNATNKSYLAGIQNITDALSDPDRYMARFGRNFTSSFVPNIISQMADYDTQALREVRSVGDAFAKKLGVRSGLDKKRNLLGEEYTAEQWMGTGFINPIAMSPVKDDPVLNELKGLNHAFRQPAPNLGGQIDMLAHENEKGQTAYDRQLELLQTVKVNGETLRKALTRLINTRAYQALTPVSEPALPSPRVQKINTILSRYRKEAKKQTLEEFPVLAKQYEQLTKARAGLKGGMQREDVLELLAQ